MKKKTPGLIILLATILFAAAGFIIAVEKRIDATQDGEAVLQEKPQQKEQQPTSKEVTLIISQNEEQKEHTLETKESITALDTLKQLSEKSQLTFTTKESSLGAFIESINGIEGNAKENTFWFLYLNGESATKGAAELTANLGDTIEWRYQKAQ